MTNRNLQLKQLGYTFLIMYKLIFFAPPLVVPRGPGYIASTPFLMRGEGACVIVLYWREYCTPATLTT